MLTLEIVEKAIEEKGNFYIVTLEDLRELLLEEKGATVNKVRLNSRVEFSIVGGDSSKKLDRFKDKFILDTLKENNYSRKATAIALGISERTLYRKIKKNRI